MSEYEARQALQQAFGQFQPKQVVRRGQLGDSNGNVMVPDRPGWAFIRYRDDLNRFSHVRYLLQEQLPDDTPVKVGKKYPDDPFEQVLGVDWEMYAYSPASGTVQQWATPAITLNDLAPGKVVPTDPASLSVDVRAFLYVNGDTAVEYGGGQIDLTGNVPGAAGHLLTLVYMDLGTDALAATDGALVAVGTDAVAPAVPEDSVPLAVVDLANGDATIPAEVIYQYKVLYDSVGGEIPLTMLGDYARGHIIRGGAADWEAYDASTDGAALYGDGTDILSSVNPTWKGTHTWTPGDDQAAIFEMDAAQSVDIFQIKDSGGTVVAGFDERGVVFSFGGAVATSFFGGADAGNSAGASATLCVFLGYKAGEDNVSGDYDTFVGAYAGANNTDNYSTLIGYNSGLGGTTAAYNSALGALTLQGLTTGDRNTALGYGAGFSIAAGELNVFVGQQSGVLCTGSRNIYIGSYAGYRQAAVSDVFLVDNLQRADAATEYTHALLYGTMSANPENQQLTINADSINIGTDADSDVIMSWRANSNNGILRWMEDEDYFQFDDDVLFLDNEKAQFGSGVDMDIYYDGSDGHIRTDLVAPSDLKVDCGTDKTVELQETVWDDFVVPANAVRLAGANPADEVTYKDGLVISFDDTVDEYAYFVIQLPHRYKEGTDVLFHLHWTIKTSGAGGGAENVKWDVTYSASSPATPAESWPASSSGTATVDVQNDSADDHLIDTIVTMSGAGYKISEVIICSLKRDTGVANNYSDEAYVASMDVHYEVDTMGSRQELAK